MSLTFLEHWADEGFSPGSLDCPWFQRLTISVQPHEPERFLSKVVKWGAGYRVAKYSTF